MSLAAVALIRSVNTNTDITGNLGFKRAATASADVGTEVAVAWLKSKIATTALDENDSDHGYFANISVSGASSSGKSFKGGDDEASAFWADFAATGICNIPMTAGACSAAESYDAAGNRVAFIIQRVCKATGPNESATCARDPALTAEGSDQSSDVKFLTTSTATYYRIVVQVRGPRNTVSYVQTVVSL
jgi:hypothetical protein